MKLNIVTDKEGTTFFPILQLVEYLIPCDSLRGEKGINLEVLPRITNTDIVNHVVLMGNTTPELNFM